jgi:hypothetical protein
MINRQPPPAEGEPGMSTGTGIPGHRAGDGDPEGAAQAATPAEAEVPRSRAVVAQAGPGSGEAPSARPGERAREETVEVEKEAPPSPLASLISASFRRALTAFVLACAGLGLTYTSGGVLRDPATPPPVDFFRTHQGPGQAAAILGAVVFFVFGIAAVRSATGEILKTVPHRLGDNRKNGLRWFCLLVGYLVVFFGTLGALNVPIERLLVGGAVTGVILGIAAQQSLANLFAGLLLLLTRPFAIGDEVSLRSGPLGGVLTGLVADMNLNYVKIVTDHGTVLLPNSSILTASVGPPGVFDH